MTFSNLLSIAACKLWKLHVAMYISRNRIRDEQIIENARVVDVMGDTLYYDFR